MKIPGVVRSNGLFTGSLLIFSLVRTAATRSPGNVFLQGKPNIRKTDSSVEIRTYDEISGSRLFLPYDFLIFGAF
jgi:hypothetical protein